MVSGCLFLGYAIHFPHALFLHGRACAPTRLVDRGVQEETGHRPCNCLRQYDHTARPIMPSFKDSKPVSDARWIQPPEVRPFAPFNSLPRESAADAVHDLPESFHKTSINPLFCICAQGKYFRPGRFSCRCRENARPVLEDIRHIGKVSTLCDRALPQTVQRSVNLRAGIPAYLRWTPSKPCLLHRRRRRRPSYFQIKLKSVPKILSPNTLYSFAFHGMIQTLDGMGYSART